MLQDVVAAMLPAGAMDAQSSCRHSLTISPRSQSVIDADQKGSCNSSQLSEAGGSVPDHFLPVLGFRRALIRVIGLESPADCNQTHLGRESELKWLGGAGGWHQASRSKKLPR